ncbi:uncharacterized protein [Haliotis cracherodii]|uniref:uncharacterized protein n=1 Tax=Haliotis cracherodii TaxID=6455 RepID=UPI0039E7E41C
MMRIVYLTLLLLGVVIASYTEDSGANMLAKIYQRQEKMLKQVNILQKTVSKVSKVKAKVSGTKKTQKRKRHEGRGDEKKKESDDFDYDYGDMFRHGPRSKGRDIASSGPPQRSYNSFHSFLVSCVSDREDTLPCTETEPSLFHKFQKPEQQSTWKERGHRQKMEETFCASMTGKTTDYWCLLPLRC